MSDQSKILLLEPEPFVRDTLRLRLLSKGHQVLTADTGEECLRALKTANVDLIIMEIALDDMDGYEVCQKLAGWERTKDIPIIILTSKRDTPKNRFMYNTWAKEYFTKPFSPNAVMKAADKLLSSSRKK